MTPHVETPPGACICPTCARLRALATLEEEMASYFGPIVVHGSLESRLSFLEGINSAREYERANPQLDAHVVDFNQNRQAWPPVQVKKSDWWFMKWLGR